MMAGYVLTESDVRVLRRMIREWNTTARDANGQRENRAGGSSDVYIAKIPEGGISAIEVAGTGTAGDSVNSAVCEIYRINQISGMLESYPSFADKQVWNISNQDLPAGYALVSKTKNGAWVASNVGGGGGESVWIDFELTEDFTEDDATVQGVIVEQFGTDDEGGTASVTLLNKIGQAFFGKSGFRGWARKVAPGQYIIIQLYQDCKEDEAGTGSA